MSNRERRKEQSAVCFVCTLNLDSREGVTKYKTDQRFNDAKRGELLFQDFTRIST